MRRRHDTGAELTEKTVGIVGLGSRKGGMNQRWWDEQSGKLWLCPCQMLIRLHQPPPLAPILFSLSRNDYYRRTILEKKAQEGQKRL